MFVSFLKYLGGFVLSFFCIFTITFIASPLSAPYSYYVTIITLASSAGLIYYCGKFFLFPLIGLVLLILSPYFLH